VCFVDPSTAHELAGLANLVALDSNPKWEGIVETNNNNGVRFLHNIYGIDVYLTQFLKKGVSETVGGDTISNGVANVFLASAPDMKPFIGSMRQEPRVETERNKDYQRDEFLLTARYGFDLYHPESVLVVLSNPTVTN
jgi:hypothetical protein